MASPCATTASCASSASPTGRSPRSRGRSSPGRGSRTSPAARRSRRSTRTRRRFSVHPLQTLTTARGPEQLDGAWAAVTAETDDGHARALWLAETLGLRPFALADDKRALYHAGAAIASNFLVTLYRVASQLLEDAGAPPEALVPLMERTIENGFELTGPIARGDWETVDRHVDAISSNRPELESVYRALAAVTTP